MRWFKVLLFSSLLFLVSSFRPVDPISLLDLNEPPFYSYIYSSWVDSVLNSMTVEEKIGQLFMVAAYSNKTEEHYSKIDSLIVNQHVGGLIFFQGGPEREIDLTNRYQKIAKVPLLIAGDWEWGLSMRLDSTVIFPRQMMLGAIQDKNLIYEMGEEIARQIKLIGGHVNFAPVVDINNNPNNPVIGSRSFGEDRESVFLRSFEYMKGLQNNQVLAVAKHFPGHGDTDVDSHKALPIISHTRERLDSIELYPFKKLFASGLGGVMVAHLFVPVLDSTKNTATTLSYKVSTELLKDELGFKGIAFTDALNMKGVSQYFDPGEVDLKALLAGNDVLLFPKDVPNAISRIKVALANHQLKLSDLEYHVRKILAVKYWVGAHRYKPLTKTNIDKSLNNEKVNFLKQRLIENALTLVNNKNRTVPLRGLEHLKIASVSIGDFSSNAFQNSLKLYTKVDDFQINKFPKDQEWEELEKKLSVYNLVIFSFNKSNRRPKNNYGISLKSIQIVEDYAKNHNVIIDIFANPYTLKKFNSLEDFKAVIVSYNDWDLTQQLSAQLIFGGLPAVGKLPISINEQYPIGTGTVVDKAVRLKYTLPIDAGIDETYLKQVDSIAINSIRKGAFPGCQILAARNGKVFYNKSFGHYTYEKKQMVENDDLYDLASMTKILATTTALMRLKDRGLFDENNTLGYYLTDLDSTNKNDLLLKDILTHQARLKPWIPFYINTIKIDSIKAATYRSEKQGKWTVKVAENLYIDSTYKDTILKQIIESKLLKSKAYKYSDLGFYLLKEVVEKQSGETINRFMDLFFYRGLGANHLTYHPSNQFPLEQIVPTEEDDYFRNQKVQAYVHDMGAAMLGGVSGHAGLFSNANDVAKQMQMLLNGGQYGGTQYLSKEVIDLFTSCQFCPDNRRALGFDKPEMLSGRLGPTCNLVSAESFGHTGFTGTMTWADPKTGIVYVFLSNRIYPKSDNNLITKINTRTKIQEIFYKAIL